MRNRALLGLAVVGAISLVPPQASAQTTYTWNNAGTNWGTASNWSPAGGPPGTLASDLAQFIPSQSNPGTIPSNPNLTAGFTFNSLTLAPNQNFSVSGWVLGGSGTITLGGTGTSGLTTYGPSEYAFNGPSLAGVGTASPNLLVNRITNGSTLILQGNSVANTNLGTTQIAGGTLHLDNSFVNIANRYSSTAGLTLSSGVLKVTGGSSATTYNFGVLTGSGTSGVNTINLNPNGGVVPTVNFSYPTGSFSTLLSTSSVWRFETSSGNLGTGAVVTFGAGTPNLGANGLLSDTSGGSGVGYAVTSDAGGVNFATWNSTSGVISATATRTVTNAAGLALLLASDRAQFNPTGAISASGAVTSGSLRISPAGAGSSLAMGANNLVSNAVMLNGSNDFTLSGTAAIGGAGTRYIHVNNPSTALTTSMVIVSGSNHTSIAGPGFVVLDGSSSQLAGGANRLDLLGGVLRGNQTQLELTAAAANGVINFRGGVLEIQNGANGTGTAADFTRALGTAAGNVRWGGGNGGFSAFGSTASVNIGGAAVPATLQWASTNFVEDGYALKFGSTKTNAIVNFLNPIQLDNGANYQLREINVAQGAGGDKTVFKGAITGAANADLVKTGTGTLELSAGVTNTYSGNTYITSGTLIINGTNSGTGRVFVAPGGTLGGNGSIAGSVFVSGAIGAGISPGILTVQGNVSFLSGSTFIVELEGTAPGTQHDQLSIDASSTYSIGTSVALTGALLNGYTPNLFDSFVIVNNPTGSPGTGTFLGLPDLSIFLFEGEEFQIAYNVGTYTVTGSGINVLTSGGSIVIAAVPEPATVMTMIAGAGFSVIGGLRYCRYKRKLARSKSKKAKTI
jgi:autotransporter-associated beta strand protein